MKKKDNRNENRILPDPEIIELFRSRNEEALTATGTKYGSLINSVCFGILRDRRDSEECYNTVLERLWNTIPPEDPKSLKAYIIRLSRFSALDRFRAEHRKKRICSDMTESLDDLSDFLTDDFSVEDEVLRKETARALNVFVSSLPEERKMLFVKRYFYSGSVSGIARETGMKQRNVKKELEAVKEELRKYLDEKGLI